MFSVNHLAAGASFLSWGIILLATLGVDSLTLFNVIVVVRRLQPSHQLTLVRPPRGARVLLYPTVELEAEECALMARTCLRLLLVHVWMITQDMWTINSNQAYPTWVLEVVRVISAKFPGVAAQRLALEGMTSSVCNISDRAELDNRRSLSKRVDLSKEAMGAVSRLVGQLDKVTELKNLPGNSHSFNQIWTCGGMA